jgi:hypothetical protein
MHAVGLTSQQRKNALLGNGYPRNNVKAVFSLRSVPRDLSSEGTPNISKTVNVKLKLLSWDPDGARIQDLLTDWSSVVMWLWLWMPVNGCRVELQVSQLEFSWRVFREESVWEGRFWALAWRPRAEQSESTVRRLWSGFAGGPGPWQETQQS